MNVDGSNVTVIIINEYLKKERTFVEIKILLKVLNLNGNYTVSPCLIEKALI